MQVCHRGANPACSHDGFLVELFWLHMPSVSLNVLVCKLGPIHLCGMSGIFACKPCLQKRPLLLRYDDGSGTCYNLLSKGAEHLLLLTL